MLRAQKNGVKKITASGDTALGGETRRRPVAKRRWSAN